MGVMPLLFGGPLCFAGAFDILSMRPFVGLDIGEAAFFVANGVEFGAGGTSVGGALGHELSPVEAVSTNPTLSYFTQPV
jgi:hypothetical protein